MSTLIKHLAKFQDFCEGENVAGEDLRETLLYGIFLYVYTVI